MSSAQSKFSFGFGGDVGYRSNYGENGLFLFADYENVLELSGGVASGKFYGIGYSLGLSLILRNEKKVQPFLGLSYNEFPRSDFYLEQNSTSGVTYVLEETKYWVVPVGVRFKFYSNDSQRKYLIIAPYFNYRFWNSPKLFVEDGIEDRSQTEQILNRISDGFGGGVRVSVTFNSFVTTKNPD